MNSSPEPPIPSDIWQRLLAFLRDRKTGQITLYVNDGHVSDSEFAERVRSRVDSP